MSKRHDIKSFKITIPQGETDGSATWTIDHDIFVYHLLLTPINIKHNDTGKLQFLVGETVISEFGGTDGILLDNSIMKVDFPQDDIVNLVNGLTIKFSVHACDTNGRELIIWVQYKE